MRGVVVGSINMDITQRVVALPAPGATIVAQSTTLSPGGKGANQAVAAARLGMGIRMLGAVGDDPFAPTLIQSLAASGVETADIKECAGSTGLATITVDDSGENIIVLTPGANALLTTEWIMPQRAHILTADTLIVQNEIPWETTCWAMAEAQSHGIRVICNLAPGRSITPTELRLCDVLIVNEIEAAIAAGLPVHDRASALVAARVLVGGGARSVVVTLGAVGSIYIDSAQCIEMPAFDVAAIDTTAAGDTYVGAFAAALDKPSPHGGVVNAMRFATAAAALAVGRTGAQASIPDRAAVDAFLLSGPALRA